MTAIVGIRCRDGVVIGADSSATFADLNNNRIIEQPTKHKIRIIDNHMILTGTGPVGYAQRFHAVVKRLYDQKEFQGKSGLEISKLLSREALKDFNETGFTEVGYTAFAAFPANEGATLCELAGGRNRFQPELKEPDDLWFVSSGSGEHITDPLLALCAQLVWPDGAPDIGGGVFMALWALTHACNVNAGGIKGPIDIAVLAKDKKGKFRATKLDADELAEHKNMIDEATSHFSKFKDVLEGEETEATVPVPKSD